jgi:hypothetical protein
MLERWWRHEARAGENLAELPTQDSACRIAFEPIDEGATRAAPRERRSTKGRTAGLAENAWWTYWKPFVFYALAPDFTPTGTGRSDCAAARCIEVGDANGPRSRPTSNSP